MNNHEFESLLHHLLGDKLCGVQASENLVRSLKKLAFFRANMDVRHCPREHWVALILEADGNTSFSDSFGFPLDFPYYPKSFW